MTSTMTPTASPSRPPAQDACEDAPAGLSLEKFMLYETRARFYMVARGKCRDHWRVLKIDRSEPSELHVSEDPSVYTQAEVNRLLQRVSEGNRSTGGLHLVTKAYGIVGFIKFLESYYMILIVKRRPIGSICGHAVYGIDETSLIAVPHPSVQSEVAHSKAELRYKKLLSGVDLSKDFFLSYTYRLMQTMQRTVHSQTEEPIPYESMFVWNAFLTREVRQRLGNTRWIVPLIHGYFQQARLSIFGRLFTITLIARRSRHFAGTRYLKRGVNDKGRVANEVETEQIVHEDASGGGDLGQISSVVQIRGSIPLFWSQETSRVNPKPDIILQRYDPVYQATRLHFADLEKRYGNPIIILNLIKTVEKRPREMILRREFANAVGYLNHTLPEEKRLKFIHWDYQKFAKGKSATLVLAVLGAVASEALDLTGIFYSGRASASEKKKLRKAGRGGRGAGATTSAATTPATSPRSTTWTEPPSVPSSPGPGFESDAGTSAVGAAAPPLALAAEAKMQSGVLRTNCIDCLDRTNVAQYAYGLAALGRQLHAMGFIDVPRIDPDSGVAATLVDMYMGDGGMGDVLSLQYGGSAAHNTVFSDRQGKWKATTQSRELLKSIRRYYSNTYTDAEKQDAINLFLGHFVPVEGRPHLWELDSDYYLHMGNTAGESPEDSPRTPSRDALSGAEGGRPYQVLGHLSLRGPSGARSPGSTREQHAQGRFKLTSFDKLTATTVGSAKNVRIYSGDPNAVKAAASDVTQVQLTTPKWLFGQQQKQPEEALLPPASEKVLSPPREEVETEEDPDWLHFEPSPSDHELYERYANPTPTDFDSWFGSGLLPGTVEDSPANQHYAALCQVASSDSNLFSSAGLEEEYQRYLDEGGSLLGLGDATGAMEAMAVEMEEEYDGNDDVAVPMNLPGIDKGPQGAASWMLPQLWAS